MNLTSTVGSATYFEDPIMITDYDGETVDFTLTQTWIDSGTVDYVAIQYPVDGGTTCAFTYDYAAGASDSYVAACEDGNAEVTVFVVDSSFSESDCPTVYNTQILFFIGARNVLTFCEWQFSL